MTKERRKLFWSKVDKSTGYGPNGDCWKWIGGQDRGYGRFRVGQKVYKAHRLAYQESGNCIAKDMCILHSCDFPSCVNPSHLSQGTKSDNNKQRAKRGRSATGKRNGRAKFTRETIIEIFKAKGTAIEIAKLYGCSRCHVSNIKNKKRRIQDTVGL